MVRASYAMEFSDAVYTFRISVRCRQKRRPGLNRPETDLEAIGFDHPADRIDRLTPPDFTTAS